MMGNALGSNFDLNVMMPVMTHNLLESIDLLAKASEVFARRCVVPLEADAERCESMIEQSLMMCTSLAPVIGYDNAAAIAKKAYAEGKTIREIARTDTELSEAELTKILDPASQTTTTK
jgi:fumarate hydratase class II